MSVNIPNSVTSIGEEAFSNCKGLTGVTIPGTLVKKIPNGMFDKCDKLTSITVRYPDGAEKEMAVSEVYSDK